ncbi:amino acid permease [Trueperella pecoris]|nr:amino acid permease [Trueperella pecoris]
MKTTSQLTRGLTSGQVAMIALSGALGTGLFLGSGSVIALAGPATVFSYAIAGALALAIVWALAEMVTVHPVPGGHGAVAAAYLGRFGGFVTRWNFAITMMVAVGAEVVASATYLTYWFEGLPLWLGTILCSAFIGALNMFSVHLYGSSEYWFSMIKVVAIVVFILLGFAVVFGAVPGHDAAGVANLTNQGGFMPKGVTGMLAAACMAVFAFGGIENVSVGAAETANPKRDIPRAAHTMIWRLLIFYVGAILVVLMLQPWTETAAETGTVEQSPFVKVLALTGVTGASHLMNAVLIIAALSAANGCLYSSSRMFHSLAVDREAPHFAAYTNVKGAPRGAVLLAMVGMAIAAALAILSPGNVFMWLYGMATIGILVTWVMVMATHLAFRSKRARAGLPLPENRLWGSPVTNVLALVATVAIFIALYWLLPIVWYAGVPYIVALCAGYWALHRTRDLPQPRDLLAESLASRDA